MTEDMPSWPGTGGSSIDASVRIKGQDRQGMERLARCCARPPLRLQTLLCLACGREMRIISEPDPVSKFVFDQFLPEEFED